MNPEISNSLVVIGALIVGWGLNSVTDWIKHRREQSNALRDRRETFELDTLLAVGGALQSMADGAVQVWTVPTHHSDYESLSEKYLAAGREAARLRELVLDDPLRSLIEDAVKAWTLLVHKALMTPAPILRTVMSRPEYIAAQDAQEAAVSGIGERVRAIYKGTVTTS